MSTIELVAKMIRDGFQLTIVDGNVRCHPASELTPELRQSVRQYKAGLLLFVPDLAGGLCPDCGTPEIVGRITGVVRCLDPECELKRVEGKDAASEHHDQSIADHPERKFALQNPTV